MFERPLFYLLGLVADAERPAVVADRHASVANLDSDAIRTATSSAVTVVAIVAESAIQVPTAVTVMSCVVELIDVAFEVMKVRFQIVHQPEHVIRVTVIVPVEAQVSSLEHFLQVVEQSVGFCQVGSQVMHVSGLVGHRMDVRRNAIELNRVRSQMAVFGLMRVME